MQLANIYDVFKLAGFNASALLVPKNTGLQAYALRALRELGLSLQEPKSIGKKEVKLFGIEVLFRRGEDIPQLLLEEARIGHLVLGLTGEDLFEEYGLAHPDNPLYVVVIYHWNDQQALYGKPTLCLINKSGKIEDIPPNARVAVRDKYRKTSERFVREFLTQDGRKPELTLYHGDLESAVARGLHDCCIDTVYTGKTVRRYGLNVAHKIKPSDLVFISARMT